MCGIFGVLKTGGAITTKDIDLTKEAAQQMYRRGPDDEGYWNNEVVAFSFRRLSIIDLSAAGHQPMISKDGKYTIIFNGELYNYLELKDQLIAKGYHFRSRTDTEVVLNALIEWGPAALSKFNGMFALTFWDAALQSVLIARDHVGMKPLYYALHQNYFVFGSQLNQVMLVFDKTSLTMDRMGLGLFLSIGYYPSPRTVFNEIKQIEPGQWLRINVRGEKESGSHFNLLAFYEENKENMPSQEQLDSTLENSVRRHLMSDVPVATFLSGGLDSGIITGLTQKIIGSDFEAYTLSNPGTAFDETVRARQVANYLKIKHHIVYPDDLFNTIKQFQEAYQEPFGDYSAIPSLMVTAEAKKNVKVMLSGDGSDEFFYGYNRMTSMLKSSAYYYVPLFLRRIIKRLYPHLPAITYSSFEVMVLKRQSFIQESVIRDLGIDEEEMAYEFLNPFNQSRLNSDVVIKLNTIHRYFQLQLLKLDRASMFNSIEARVPFADKELMRYTIAYTAKEVTRDDYRQRKIPLKKLYSSLYPELPLIDEPKKGFTIDMAKYLQNELKEYYLDLLRTRTLFFDLIDFNSMENSFLKGHNKQPFFNWSLLSLQVWSKKYF